MQDKEPKELSPQEPQGQPEKSIFARAVHFLHHGVTGYAVYDEILDEVVPLDFPFPPDHLESKLTSGERLAGAIYGRYPSAEILAKRTSEYYEEKERKDAVGQAEAHLIFNSQIRRMLLPLSGTNRQVMECVYTKLVDDGDVLSDEAIALELGLTPEKVVEARKDAMQILQERELSFLTGDHHRVMELKFASFSDEDIGIQMGISPEEVDKLEFEARTIVFDHEDEIWSNKARQED